MRVEQIVAVGLETVATQLVPRGHRPDVGEHAPLVTQHLLCLQRPRHGHARRENLRARALALAGSGVEVHALEQRLHIEALGLRRLRVGLVVDGEVVEDVLGVLAVHATQTVAHDVPELETVGRVVGDDGRVGCGEQQRMAVLVLQALTVERRATGGATDDEAADHLVHGQPELVTGALEAEHRVEDVDRDHRLVMRRVRRTGGDERRHRTGLVDALVQDLAGSRLLVRQHEFAVDGVVRLAPRRVDAQRREQCVHAERAGLVGDDRDEALADVFIACEVLEQAHECHRGGHALRTRTAAGDVVHRVAGQHERTRLAATRRHGAAERCAVLLDVAHLGAVLGRLVVRRLVGVGLELGVGDRDVQSIAEGLEVLQRQLLHLVRGVATLELRAQAPALDRLREDDRRLALVLGGRLVGRVHLLVVVAAALERPDLVVGHVCDEVLRARIAAEEVVADVGAVLGLERLVVTVDGGVHQVQQRAFLVGGEQRIPVATPDDLDDVPAGAAEDAFEFLDDLAVAANRAVEALQVRVDDERQVVQAFACGEADGAQRLRLVGLAVAEERPHLLIGGVLDAAPGKVAVEARLVDGVVGAQTHRHRRELPEVGHEPRVRVGRDAATCVRHLLPETVELVLAEATLEVCAGVHARRGVALEEDLVAAAGVVLAAEEVVEAHLVQARGGGEGRDVAADADAGALGTVHDHRRVPPQVGADAVFDLLVAGELRIAIGGDGVDVVGLADRRDPDVALA